MLNYHNSRLARYIEELKNIDPLAYNQFIFRHLIIHLFKTEHIMPFIIAICVVGFSIEVTGSNFTFIPQTNIAAFASFFLFTLVSAFITLIIYPLLLIVLFNFITSYIHGSSTTKFWFKIIILLLCFIAGAMLFTRSTSTFNVKMQIVITWIGIYAILSGLYLTHKEHKTLSKLTKTKITFIIIVALIMSRPLLLIYLHTSEALNFTNINAQIYLDNNKCAILTNLNGKNTTSPTNSIFNNHAFFESLPNNQGCYIYGNTIRYSFAADYVLLVKVNIEPLISKNGRKYNEYVRLSCYSSNCYSENQIYIKDRTDIYSDLIKSGTKFDHPFDW